MRRSRWLVAPFGLALVAWPDGAAAQSDTIASRLDETRVVASASEVRIVFPRDTGPVWSWSTSEARNYYATYVWGVKVEGVESLETLRQYVSREGGRAREFRSLDSLVAAGSILECPPGGAGRCSPSDVTAEVQEGRVVLRIRQPALIRRLFGLRPTHVRVWRSAPGVVFQPGEVHIPVEYVEPQVPEPPDSLRAAAVAARRRHDRSISLTSRRIASGAETDPAGPLWLAVGETVGLAIEESRCRYDSCSVREADVTHSGWSVADSGVIRLRSARDEDWPSVSIVGRRPGRTKVGVSGIRGPSDTLPSSTPPPGALEREVVVTVPVARVRISPRPDTIRVGQSYQFRIRVTDRAGRVHRDAPAEFRLREEGGGDGVGWGPEPIPVTFSVPSRYTLIASFGGRTDTVKVVVVPATR